MEAEKNAREKQEKTLSNNIEGVRNALGLEVAARKEKDTELDGKITGEAKARTQLEQRLSDRLDQGHEDLEKETGERKAEDTKIREEFAKADTELEKAINENKDAISDNKDNIKYLKQNKADKGETENALKENKDQINQEIKDRKSANTILNQSIKDEAAAREEKDTELDGKIIAEEAARKAEDKKIRDEFAEADKKLDGKITAEAKAREDADKELEKKLTGRDNALAGRIDKLATDTDKGLAKVSALAGLHPLDYDPANKLNLAAAGGSYNGEHAFALGAFYRPNRNVMLSFGASLAGGDNAYNVGVSVKVGKGGDRINESNTTVSELYYLVGQLQDQIAEQQRKIEELEAK